MRAKSTPAGANDLKRIALLWAYPALRRLPCVEWAEALERSRETAFDTVESIGVLVGVAVVTFLLQFDATQAAAFALPARYFIEFLAALPLLVLVVGPFYLRRTRRGLDQELERRRDPASIQPRK